HQAAARLERRPERRFLCGGLGPGVEQVVFHVGQALGPGRYEAPAELVQAALTGEFTDYGHTLGRSQVVARLGNVQRSRSDREQPGPFSLIQGCGITSAHDAVYTVKEFRSATM